VEPVTELFQDNKFYLVPSDKKDSISSPYDTRQEVSALIDKRKRKGPFSGSIKKGSELNKEAVKDNSSGKVDLL